MNTLDLTNYATGRQNCSCGAIAQITSQAAEVVHLIESVLSNSGFPTPCFARSKTDFVCDVAKWLYRVKRIQQLQELRTELKNSCLSEFNEVIAEDVVNFESFGGVFLSDLSDALSRLRICRDQLRNELIRLISTSRDRLQHLGNDLADLEEGIDLQLSQMELPPIANEWLIRSKDFVAGDCATCPICKSERLN